MNNPIVFWLTRIVLSVFFVSSPLYAAKPSQLQEVIPNDFPTVANFFLQADCRFVYLTAYLYNTKTAHWLSADEAKQTLPAAAEIFNRDCTVQSSPAELAATFNLTLPEQAGLILLYIGPLQGMMESDFYHSNIEPLTHHMALLQQLEDIPQYKVTTPLTGYRLN